jgi:hypothetical protein
MRSIAASAFLALLIVSGEANKMRNLANDKDNNNPDQWTRTVWCNCYEYLTDPFFRDSKYNFDTTSLDHHLFDEDIHSQSNGYDRMSEFCCEFAAELVDPTCEKNANGRWVNGDGEPPHAPKEHLICDLFDTPDIFKRTKLMQQARDACFCFYRHHGCGREELNHGGYCDYPHSEVTLDDYRMANNTPHNMCNSCLEDDNQKRYLYPSHYEGKPHGECLGYCLLKRGDPTDVYRPNVTDERCCLGESAKGIALHGFDEEHLRQEIIFNPFKTEDEQSRTYFFDVIQAESEANVPSSSNVYEIMIKYDGLARSYLSVQRFNEERVIYDMDEFPLHCQPEDWDNLSIHIFDESKVAGIVFQNVTMDGVELGDFGFAVQRDCTDVIEPVVEGMPGHNYTCVTRPGGYGHMSGFEFKGFVNITGPFRDDDIGLELIVGCSRKQHTMDHQCCGGDGQVNHHHYHDFHYNDVTAMAEKWMDYPIPEKLNA